jgi:ketosteroid isomerase-like protein
MSTSNLAVVRQFYDHVFAGNLESLRPLLADSFNVVEADGLPYAGVFRGYDGLMALMAKVQSHWGTQFSGEIEHYIASGDRVAVLLLMKGVEAETGAAVSVPLCEVWELKEGKVASVRPFYWDTAQIAALRLR